MIPYVELRSISFGGIRVGVQPLLGAAAIMVAHLLFVRRARRLGLNPDVAATLSLAMALTGLTCAFLFRWAYLPEALAQDPWIWTKTTVGASSFGGFLGGLVAALAYFALCRMPWREAQRYLDTLAYVFPAAWIIGRMGCCLVHDHPGVRSGSILAVQYPGFPRYDLAVLEVLFLALFVLPLFALLDRRYGAAPCYFGLFLVIYGLLRIALDQLHIDPPRYLGFTVDSLAYSSMALAGLIHLAHRAGGNKRLQ